MPLTVIDRNGPPEAMLCPAVVCDVCGVPIHSHDGRRTGLALWRNEGHDDEARPRPFVLRFVHQGECDRRAEAQWGDHWSQHLDEYLEQLVHNYRHPFEVEPGVEYVAPSPSRWRLGRYSRKETARR